jgi:hypothetical protein
MDVSDLLAITLKEKLKIKVAKWGTPKKYFKKRIPHIRKQTSYRRLYTIGIVTQQTTCANVS